MSQQVLSFPPTGIPGVVTVPAGTLCISPEAYAELRAMVKGDDEEQVEHAMTSIWRILQEPWSLNHFNQGVTLAKEALAHLTRLPPAPDSEAVIPAVTFVTLGILLRSHSVDISMAVKYRDHALESIIISPRPNIQALSAMPPFIQRVPARFAPGLIRHIGTALDVADRVMFPYEFVSMLAALHKNHGVPVERRYQLAACRTILMAAMEAHIAATVARVMKACKDIHVLCPLSLCVGVLKSMVDQLGFKLYAGLLLFGYAIYGEYQPGPEPRAELMDLLLPCAVRVLAIGPSTVASSAQLVLIHGRAYERIAEKVLLAPESSTEVNSGYVLWLAKQAVKKRMLPTDCLTPEEAIECMSFVKSVPDAWEMLGGIMPEFKRVLLRDLASGGDIMTNALIVVAEMLPHNPPAIAGYEHELAHRLLHMLFSGQLTTHYRELVGSLQSLLGGYEDPAMARLFLPRLDELCRMMIELPDPASHPIRWAFLATSSKRFGARVEKWMVQCMPQVIVCIKTAAATGALQGAWVRSALGMVSTFALSDVASAPLRAAALDACLQLCESTPAKNCYCIQTTAWEACAELAASMRKVQGSSLQPLAKRILPLMVQHLAGHAKPRASRGCGNTVSAQHGVFSAASEMLPLMGELAALGEQLRALAGAVVTCLASPARCPLTRAEGCHPIVPALFRCPSHCSEAIELAAVLISRDVSRERLIQSLLARANDGNELRVRIQAIALLGKVVKEGYFRRWMSKYLDVLLLALRSATFLLVYLAAKELINVYSEPSPILASYTPDLAEALHALVESDDESLAAAMPLLFAALECTLTSELPEPSSADGSGSGQGQGQGRG